jgi:hypothetical protein
MEVRSAFSDYGSTGVRRWGANQPRTAEADRAVRQGGGWDAARRTSHARPALESAVRSYGAAAALLAEAVCRKGVGATSVNNRAQSGVTRGRAPRQVEAPQLAAKQRAGLREKIPAVGRRLEQLHAQLPVADAEVSTALSDHDGDGVQVLCANAPAAAEALRAEARAAQRAEVAADVAAIRAEQGSAEPAAEVRGARADILHCHLFQSRSRDSA